MTPLPVEQRRPRHRLPCSGAWIASAALAASLAGCGGGSEVLLVPFFTFGFAYNGALAGADHDMFLNLDPNAPTTATGTLEATSTLRIDTDRRAITGTYAGCTLSITVGPQTEGTLSALIAPSYSVRFSGPNTLVLTPPTAAQPTLTLTRAGGQLDPRPQTC